MDAGHGLVVCMEPLWTMLHVNDPTATYDPDTDSLTISGGGQPKAWSASPDGLIECGIDANGQWVALRVHDAESSFGPCIDVFTGRTPTSQLEDSLLDDWFPRGLDGCRVLYAPKYNDFFEILWTVPAVGEIELLPDGSVPEELPIPDVSAFDIAKGVTIYVEESHPFGFSVQCASEILGPVLTGVL